MNRSPPRLQPQRLPPSPLSQSVSSSPRVSAQAGNGGQPWGQPLLDRKGSPSEEFIALIDSLFDQLVVIDRHTNLRTDFVDADNYARYCQHPQIAPVLLSAPMQNLRKLWEVGRIPYRVGYDERGLPVARLGRDDFRTLCVWQMKAAPGPCVEVWNRTIEFLKLEQRIDQWRWAFGKLPLPGDNRIPPASPGLMETFLAWQTSLQRAPSSSPFDTMLSSASTPITPSSAASTPMTPSPSPDSNSYYATASQDSDSSSTEKKQKKDGWLKTLVKKRSGILASPKSASPTSPPEPLPPLPNIVRVGSPLIPPSATQPPVPPMTSSSRAQYSQPVQQAPPPAAYPVNTDQPSYAHARSSSNTVVTLPSHPSQRAPRHHASPSLAVVSPGSGNMSSNQPQPYGPPVQGNQQLARPATAPASSAVRSGDPRAYGTPQASVQHNTNESQYKALPNPYEEPHPLKTQNSQSTSDIRPNGDERAVNGVSGARRDVKSGGVYNTSTDNATRRDRPERVVDRGSRTQSDVKARIDKASTKTERAAYDGAVIDSDSGDSSSSSSSLSSSESEDDDKADDRNSRPRAQRDVASIKPNSAATRSTRNASSSPKDKLSISSGRDERPNADIQPKAQKQPKSSAPTRAPAPGLPTGPKKSTPAPPANTGHGWHGWSMKGMVDRVENLAHQVQDFAKEADELEESVDKAGKSVERAVAGGQELEENVDDAWQPNTQQGDGENAQEDEDSETDETDEKEDKEAAPRKTKGRRQDQGETETSSSSRSKGSSQKSSREAAGKKQTGSGRGATQSRGKAAEEEEEGSGSSSDSGSSSGFSSETESQEPSRPRASEQVASPRRDAPRSQDTRSYQPQQHPQNPPVQKVASHWGVKGLASGIGKLSHGVEGFADRMHEWEDKAEKAGKSVSRAAASAQKTYSFF